MNEIPSLSLPVPFRFVRDPEKLGQDSAYRPLLRCSYIPKATYLPILPMSTSEIENRVLALYHGTDEVQRNEANTWLISFSASQV